MMKLRLFKTSRFIRRFSSKISEKVFHDEHVEKLLETYSEKILFSSYIENKTFKFGYRKNRSIELKIEENIRKAILNNNAKPFPVSLKYLEPDVSSNKTEESTFVEPESKDTYFPYAKISKEYLKCETKIPNQNLENFHTENNEKKSKNKLFKKIDHNWMNDYEIYSNDLKDDISDYSNYGTPDPKYKNMGPPCGGCGALLNCVSTGMPGYLPGELYKGRNQNELQGVVCQRCHFLKNYNIALNLTVEPDYYNALLSNLKNKFGLIVLLVDLLDFPCCIWPGLVDLIGKNRPLFVVGNKVDLMPKDSKGYLNRIKERLEEAVIKAGFNKQFIKHTTLVSASTGYGIEDLITSLHKQWGTKGDVYIVGCTNVGKSTIFNALLGSDLCKIQATDLIQRATASPWPGTTLNMLRFPILRPSGLRMFLRNERLKKELKEIKAEKELNKLQNDKYKVTYPSLIGHIGTTFRVQLAQEEVKDIFSIKLSNNLEDKGIGINEKSPEFKESKWCYDTPGVMHNNQILDLLTTDEILLTLPQQRIKIRNFCLQSGYALLLAGLGRVDYLEGDYPIRVSVFASQTLPILICKIDDAEEIYESFLGTPVLGVPEGSNNRLDCWPGLKACGETTVTGEHGEKAVIDFLLSSAGWVSVTPFPTRTATLRHYTLAGRGGIVRIPPLILYGSSMRGKRIRNSPAYEVKEHFSRKHGQLM